MGPKGGVVGGDATGVGDGVGKSSVAPSWNPSRCPTFFENTWICYDEAVGGRKTYRQRNWVLHPEETSALTKSKRIMTNDSGHQSLSMTELVHSQSPPSTFLFFSGEPLSQLNSNKYKSNIKPDQVKSAWNQLKSCGDICQVPGALCLGTYFKSLFLHLAMCWSWLPQKSHGLTPHFHIFPIVTESAVLWLLSWQNTTGWWF
jgi:hypothetical protein